jgi:hypothetical protein
MGTRRWLLLVFLIGLAHAGAYALLVPPWQAPDEPGHYEAACLLGQAQRPLTGDDLSLPLQQEIIANLAQHDFWSRVRAPWPAPLPSSFAADPFLERSGRQIGDEPPLYYLLPALICRSALPIEARLRLIRLFGAVLFGFTGVVAAWGASGQGNKETEKQRAAADLQTSGGNSSLLVSLFPYLLAYFLVLLPMPAFIAGSANNDALAMLTATAVFAAVLRIQRLGWTWRRGLGLVLLVLLASISKKTNSFLLPWLALLGLAAGWQWLRRDGWSRVSVAKISLGAVVVAIVLLLPTNSPATWRTLGMPWVGRQRDTLGLLPPGAPDTSAAVMLDGHLRRGVIQTLAGRSARALQGQTVYATIWVRSADDRPAAGRLTVRDAAGPSEVDFVAGSHWQSVAIRHTVALTTARVRVAVTLAVNGEAQPGGLLLAHAELFSEAGADRAGNLLRNGDFRRSARLGELLVLAPLQDRVQRFAPRVQTGGGPAAAPVARYGLYSLLTFAGFWGNFGWLQRPLPLWIYATLGLGGLMAAAGVIRCLQRPHAGSCEGARAILLAWLLAIVVIAGQTFLPMFGRDWQPQGRYLFPALLPIAGLWLAGLETSLTLTAWPRRRTLLLAALVAFDLVCLLRAAFVI